MIIKLQLMLVMTGILGGTFRDILMISFVSVLFVVSGCEMQPHEYKMSKHQTSKLISKHFFLVRIKDFQYMVNVEGLYD